MAKQDETNIDDIDELINEENTITQVEQLDTKEPEQLGLDLFELSTQEYSNAIDIYDILGKSVYGKTKKYLRGKVTAEETRLTSQCTAINKKGEKVQIQGRIYAARIERKNTKGENELVFSFPSTREDIIESVIRKFATDSRAKVVVPKVGDHKDTQLISVQFSLYELFNELKRNNRQYSYQQIQEALQILHDSKFEITDPENPDNLVSSTRLPIYISRATTKSPMIYVCLHPLLSQQVKHQQYRRYNLQQTLSLENNYARNLYVRLSIRWRQAGQRSPYNILLSTLVEEMMLDASERTTAQNKRTIDAAMHNLIDNNILLKVNEAIDYDGKKIVNCKYEIYPSAQFIAEMKKHNKHHADISMESIDIDNEAKEVKRYISPLPQTKSYTTQTKQYIKKLNRGLTPSQAAMFAQRIVNFCNDNPLHIHAQNLMVLVQRDCNDWNEVKDTIAAHLRSPAVVNEYLPILIEVGFGLAPKEAQTLNDDDVF